MYSIKIIFYLIRREYVTEQLIIINNLTFEHVLKRMSSLQEKTHFIISRNIKDNKPHLIFHDTFLIKKC